MPPDALARWRGRALGAITERTELDLVLDLAGPLRGKAVLDAGCGDGTYGLAAAKRGGRVTAVDLSGAMLDAAGARALRSGVELDLVEADVRALPLADATFDLAVAVTVLCFMSDADARRTVRELARVLRPGGRLVLGELAPRNLWAASRRARAWLGWSPTWRGVHFRDSAALGALLEDAGMRVEQVRGAVYYPPVGVAARLAARLDSLVGRFTTVGAAFIAASATKVIPVEGAQP